MALIQCASVSYAKALLLSQNESRWLVHSNFCM